MNATQVSNLSSSESVYVNQLVSTRIRGTRISGIDVQYKTGEEEL